MEKITYPFSQNPQENVFPKEKSIIYSRFYISRNGENTIDNRIEIDLKRLSENFPEIKEEELSVLTEKFLNAVVQIDVIKSQKIIL